MPDETPKSATEQTKETAKPKTVKVGDKVNLVTARGQALQATIDKLHKNGTADLSIDEQVIVCGACRDDGMAKADSWHPVQE